MSEVTRILSQIESGDLTSAEHLLPLVYEELRKLAAARLAQESPGQSLQATALVHEAYVRLVDTDSIQHWNSRGHFFAAAAEAMRRILVDKARTKLAKKHGGGLARQIVELGEIAAPQSPSKVLAIHEALTKFELIDRLGSELVKLRFFAGMTVPEASKLLGISTATADRHWTYARAWLHAELANQQAD